MVRRYTIKSRLYSNPLFVSIFDNFVSHAISFAFKYDN